MLLYQHDEAANRLQMLKQNILQREEALMLLPPHNRNRQCNLNLVQSQRYLVLPQRLVHVRRCL